MGGLASGFPLPLGHSRAGLEEVLDESCRNDVEDVSLELEEPVDNPGTTTGPTFSVLHIFSSLVW